MWYNWSNTLDNNSTEGFICEWDCVVDTDKQTQIFIPQDVYHFNDHKYKYFRYSMTWQEAKLFCEELGGHLATITSSEEWDFVRDKAKSNTGHWWLGATDEKLRGEWKWVTGERWNFTAWSNEYPNNNASANYLYISSTRDYMWYNWPNSLDNNSTEGFICEWDYCCISYNGYFSRHNWNEWTISSEAKCEIPGERIRVCKNCGEENIEVIDALTHEYKEWEIVNGSKLIPPIEKERKCSLCGNVETTKDWSYVWVPIVCALAAVGCVIGVANYICAFKTLNYFRLNI